MSTLMLFDAKFRSSSPVSCFTYHMPEVADIFVDTVIFCWSLLSSSLIAVPLRTFYFCNRTLKLAIKFYLT